MLLALTCAALAATPVMLVTNYPEHQQAAVEAGAEPGFGKDVLRSAETAALVEDAEGFVN